MKSRQSYLISIHFIVLLWFGSLTVAWANHYEEAKVVVSEVVSEFLDNIKRNKNLYEKDKAGYYAYIENVVRPSVSIDLSARFILGQHWKTASDDQRSRFTTALQKMLISSYGKALLVLDDVRVEYIPPEQKTESKRKQIIRTRLIASDGLTNVDYVLLKYKNKWLIFDLVIDGLSLVKQLHHDLGAEIKETNLEALIERLQSVQ